MDESALIEKWNVSLNLDDWWKELLGQPLDSPESFSFMDSEAHLPWSEYNTSQEILRKIGYHLSYVEASKTWYAWDGRIHSPCDGEALAYKMGKMYFRALRRALSEVESLVNSRKHALEASGASETDIKQLSDTYTKGFRRQRDYRDKISSDAGLSSLVRMMRSDFSVPRDHYDNDQSFLVVKNCVFDLDAMRANASVAPMAHDPSRPVTKYLDATYDTSIPFDQSVWWDYLKSSVKDSDPDTLAHLQKVVGAAFMGESKLRTMINFMGPPSSGKSIFVETLWKMGREGSGYCAMPDSRAITKVQGQNFEQDDFRGKRFIAISEPSSREEIDDDFLKRYSGDENMKTRTLNAKSTDWKPQGVVFISSNAVLKINTRDEAIVDRMQVINFPYQFKDLPDPNNPMHKKKDVTLPNKLATEHTRSAILNWIIWGMIHYINGGQLLTPPASIEANKLSMVSNASSALRWVHELLEEGDLTFQLDRQANSHLQVNEAYPRYTLWCAVNGERRALTKKFFEEDIAHRYPTDRYSGNKVFLGLGFSNNFYSKLDGMKYNPNVPLDSPSAVDVDF